MTLELIPVIEIGYANQNVPMPDKSPYWDYPENWDLYNEECYLKAGFKDKLTPYLKGSSFYKLSDISDNNLTKLIIDHTQEMRDKKLGREEVYPFMGGCVLRINEQDKYFPQCCCDLSDIEHWKDLVSDKFNFFYQGHPEPRVEVNGLIVTLDFTVADERFAPPPVDNIISFEISTLKKAIEFVKTELDEFSNRLKKINTQQNLGIENIDELLIWGN